MARLPLPLAPADKVCVPRIPVSCQLRTCRRVHTSTGSSSATAPLQVFLEAGGVKAGGPSREQERARQQRLAHAGG